MTPTAYKSAGTGGPHAEGWGFGLVIFAVGDRCGHKQVLLVRRSGLSRTQRDRQEHLPVNGLPRRPSRHLGNLAG